MRLLLSLAAALLQTLLLAVLVESLSAVPRRAFIANSSVLTTSALLHPTSAAFAVATDGRGGKPFAPLEALLPATRLKLWVDEIYVISKDLSIKTAAAQQRITIQQMNDKLSNPPKLFQGETMAKRTNNPTAQLTTAISSANKGEYQMNRKSLNLGDKFTAILNQADVERQWGMLQYAESKREEDNEMRAAFNFYSRQLTFSDEYMLTASKEKKKEMIRNDQLPSITEVITSDLDRRDLYRNQFLTAIDDLTAEVTYQVKQKTSEEIDVTDTVSLMNEAHDACENWFSLIASQDVEEAITAVKK
ncbi:hypothetical protein ACHAWC_002321 [Mediolabrus comicus]